MLVMYVNVISGVTCCSIVRRACGLFSTPCSVGRCAAWSLRRSAAAGPRRDSRAPAPAAPMRRAAESSAWASPSAAPPAFGSDVRRIARRQQRDDLGELQRRVGARRQVQLADRPETVRITSTPRAFVSRSISSTGSIFTGLKNEIAPWSIVNFGPEENDLPLRDDDAAEQRGIQCRALKPQIRLGLHVLRQRTLERYVRRHLDLHVELHCRPGSRPGPTASARARSISPARKRGRCAD